MDGKMAGLNFHMLHARVLGNARRSSGLLLVLCFGLIAQLLNSGVSYAFNEADLAKLLTTKQCQWCNLHHADLSGAQLPGAQLSSASLTGANLSGANLSSAFLNKANLSGANLSNAYLVDANLSNADLSRANLSDANLSSAIWTNGRKCEKNSYGECKLKDLLP